jgi:hypothetical protein
MWRYSYEIAGGILIVLSSLVSEEMPKKWRLPMWIGFVILALLYSGFGIHLANQGEADEGKRDGAIKELQEKLSQSNLEQARMTGQLTAMREIMESFSKTGIPGFKELGEGISNLMQSNAKRAADAALSDKQLCERATQTAHEIRAFQSKFDSEDRQRFLPTTTNQNLTPEQTRAEWEHRMQEEIRISQQHSAEFLSLFAGDAKYLKDAMLEKLPLSKRDTLAQNNRNADMNLNAGMMAGAFNEYAIANYLDEIAKTLCPARHH